MNMPMQFPLPLQLLQPQRFTVPPLLRRALLCCAAALIGALLLYILSSAWRAEAEAERDDARAGKQKTAMQLASAHEAESSRAARAKRFAPIKTALENAPPGKTEWEQLTGLLSTHPHIVEPTLDALPAQAAFPAAQHLPVITLQTIRIEAGLLHEEALLALNAVVAASPAHTIPTGCSLRRQADTAPITLRARCEFDWAALVPSRE